MSRRKDLLDKYGIEYDENKIYTLEDLSEIFATVQAEEREMPSTGIAAKKRK